eukprot:scaffold243490_cov13-Tisochrysis_lutea.AAC.1
MNAKSKKVVFPPICVHTGAQPCFDMQPTHSAGPQATPVTEDHSCEAVISLTPREYLCERASRLIERAVGSALVPSVLSEVH